TGPPVGLRLGFDGAHLRADWTPPGGSGVTGYVVELLQDGAMIESQTPAASPQGFASGLAAGRGATGRAGAPRGPRPGAWGPPPATGPYAATIAYTFDGAGRLLTMTWNGARSQTYTLDAAGNVLSVQST